MSTKKRIAVAQVPVVSGDIDANLRRMAEWMAAARDQGAGLVLFPECCLTGYVFDSRQDAVAVAIDVAGAAIGTVQSLCLRYGIEVIVGFLEKNGDKLYNTAALVGPQGLMGLHRKRHMPFLGADRFVDEPDGAEVPVFETSVGKVGIAICYEIRFPEVFRTLTLEGAEIIALPTNWPMQSSLLAEIFTRVRAAENLVYLLVANRADHEGDTSFLGRSQIVDPLGTVIVDAGKTEGVFSAEVDLARARDKTITISKGAFELSPMKDRRPSTYRLT